MVRIVLADDHPIVREGLHSLLETQPDFQVIAECANGEETIQTVESLQPDLLLLDLEMPILDGVETIRKIHTLGLSKKPSIIVFTAFSDDDRIIHAIQAGANGYLLKDAPRDKIFQAIRTTSTGGSILQPIMATKLNQSSKTKNPAQQSQSTSSSSSIPQSSYTLEELTERETEVLRLLAQGMPNKEIALHLIITERTAKFHVSSIMNKLGATNRTEAVALAAQYGLITLHISSS